MLVLIMNANIFEETRIDNSNRNDALMNRVIPFLRLLLVRLVFDLPGKKSVFIEPLFLEESMYGLFVLNQRMSC